MIDLDEALIGKTFNQLTVLGFHHRQPNGQKYFLCECSCGNTRVIRGTLIHTNKQVSCGCYRPENVNTRPECDKNDIVGQKFNKLTVLKWSHVGNRRKHHYLCRCDCGTETIITKHSIVGGKTKSCGCLHSETIRGPYAEGTFNALFSRYKRCAKKGGREFTLTKEEFRSLTSSNCHYCGVKPYKIFMNGRKKDYHGGYLWNGIDRVDNNKGYTTENSVPCCEVCNKAKRTLTVDEFKEWVVNIYEHFINGESQ